MAKKQEKHAIEILHLTTPTGGKRFAIFNERTGFSQVVRKLTVALRIQSHWVDRDLLR